MICIVCNALETRMSSKGKKFIKPMELFRLVRNREHCRECRKPKGAQGKGRAVGGQEQGKEPTRRKTRMSQAGMIWGGVMLGVWLLLEVQCAYLAAAGGPLSPRPSPLATPTCPDTGELVWCLHKPI